MTLHSQKPFNFHNEDKGRDHAVGGVPLVKYSADEARKLEDAMINGIPAAGRSSKKAFAPNKVGRPSMFSIYEALFHKHGELTTNDVRNMLPEDATIGKTRQAVGGALGYFWRLGLLERERVKSTWLWRLADDESGA
ncbi:MAG: hypothetical protein ACPG4X_15920 [Pikeienuella sp.]